MNYPYALKGVVVAARYIRQKIRHNYADISKDYDSVAQTYDAHYSKCLLSGLRVFSETASDNLRENSSLKKLPRTSCRYWRINKTTMGYRGDQKM